jgi:hypothetical protein
MKMEKNSDGGSGSWHLRVRRELEANPPFGWAVVNGITGVGVYLLPDEEIFREHNLSGRERRMVGPLLVVFEFFRLSRSGAIKLSARVSGVRGDKTFNALDAIARAANCPAPKASVAHQTQSVAAWMSYDERPMFESADHPGMANWIREFLKNPPDEFRLFLSALRDYLKKR